MNQALGLEQRLADGEIIILDGAIGTELERLGAPMHQAAWCATAMDTHLDQVRAVHRGYIEAGADVITANTYATTHSALESGGLLDRMQDWNRLAVEVAREEMLSSEVERPLYLAGSVSNFGNFGQIPDEVVRPHFREQAEILTGAGVDLLLLETLGAQTSTIVAIIEEVLDTGLPVWVAVSCVHDGISGEVHLGVEESQSSSEHRRVHEPLERVAETVSRAGGSALLLMHSDLKAILPGLEVTRKHYPGRRGAYPNAGYWLRPEWSFVDQVSPEDYLDEARAWVATGAQIVGGCCGIGPSHIEALHRGLRGET